MAAQPAGAQGPRRVIEPRAQRSERRLHRRDRLRQHVDRVGEDQERERLVEERRDVHREEHERQPHDQSRQPETDVRDGAQRGAALRREANREKGHRDGQRRRRHRGEQRNQPGSSQRGEKPGARPGGRLNQPVETDADRQDERREQYQQAESEPRPLPAAERVDAGRPGLRGPGRRAGSAFEPTRGGEHQQGREHEQQGEPRGGMAVQRSADLVVDGPGEGLVAQQRNGAEVAQGVEGRQQSAGQQGGGQQRQGHPPEAAPAARAENPRGIVQRGVQDREPGAGRQVHVRIVEEDEHQEGARKTVDLGKPLPSGEGFERPLEESARSQRGGHGEGRHVGRHGERERQQAGQEAPAREVGPRGEPRQRQSQSRGSQRHRPGQEQRPAGDPETALAQQHVEQPATGHRPSRQIDERQQAHRRNDDPGGAEAPRRQAGAGDRNAHRYREALFMVSRPPECGAGATPGPGPARNPELPFRSPLLRGAGRAFPADRRGPRVRGPEG